MIFERIDGDVKAVLNGNTLTLGDIIDDSHWPLVFVIGVGKVVFRVDPNCTVERIGKTVSVEEVVAEPAPEPTPEPIPAPAPVSVAKAPVEEPKAE